MYAAKSRFLVISAFLTLLLLCSTAMSSALLTPGGCSAAANACNKCAGCANGRQSLNVATVDDALLSFADMEDDSARRGSFEAYLKTKILEQDSAHDRQSMTIERISDMSFVKNVNDSLVRLGQVAQEEAWEKHVVGGFAAISSQNTRLWRFVDLLIQFKVLVKGYEKQGLAFE